MSVILSPRGNEASNMMKRFVRYEEAAQYFGLDETLIISYAKAAGAVYQLCKIRLIVNGIIKIPTFGGENSPLCYAGFNPSVILKA